MRLQIFVEAHSLVVVGQAEIEKDAFARCYVDGARVALTRVEAVFTTLICADGQRFHVMTDDWQVAQRMAGLRTPP